MSRRGSGHDLTDVLPARCGAVRLRSSLRRVSSSVCCAVCSRRGLGWGGGCGRLDGEG